MVARNLGGLARIREGLAIDGGVLSEPRIGVMFRYGQDLSVDVC